MKISTFCATEFSLKGFTFHHIRPSDFYQSQWEWLRPHAFVAYRVILGLGMLVWLACDIPLETNNFFRQHPHIWFVYATNWAFGCLTLTTFLLAIYAMIFNCRPTLTEEVPFYQVLWFLYNIAANTTLTICLTYWVVLSGAELELFTSPVGRLKHALTAVLVLVDLSLSAIPVRLLHVVYPIILGIIYSIFTYIFWVCKATGSYKDGQIYPGLNWEHTVSGVVACFCLALVTFVMQIVLYVIFFLRVQMSARLKGRGYATTVDRTGYDELEPKQETMAGVSMNQRQNDMLGGCGYSAVE